MYKGGKYVHKSTTLFNLDYDDSNVDEQTKIALKTFLETFRYEMDI